MNINCNLVREASHSALCNRFLFHNHPIMGNQKGNEYNTRYEMWTNPLLVYSKSVVRSWFRFKSGLIYAQITILKEAGKVGVWW